MTYPLATRFPFATTTAESIILLVAYSEELAERIRDLLSIHSDLTERKMFGGIAWMLSGNMACGVMGDDLLVRTGGEDRDAALAEEGVREFDFTGKTLGGFVVVAPDSIAEPDELARWVETGVGVATSLPPK